MELPAFRYHPDPQATGMIVASGNACIVCRQSRGFVYAGVPYGVRAIEEKTICPWCIADGSARRVLEVEFVDAASIGASGDWSGDSRSVPPEVVEEVAYRTPGFTGWQQEQWLTHCGDAAAFVGTVGAEQLAAFGPLAVEAIRDSTGLDEGDDWDEFFAALDADDSPCAHLFRCLHCGEFGGYTDTD